MVKLSNHFKNGNSLAKRLCYEKKNACGVNDTACTVHTLSLPPHAKYDTACTIDERFMHPWQPLKGISIKNMYVRELSYPTTTKIYKFQGATIQKISCMRPKIAHILANSKQNSKRL
jgi:hypothetical protein